MLKLNSLLSLFKFLNLTDKDGNLSPSKIMIWGITATILIILYNVGLNQLTLDQMGVFAGVLTSLIGSFAAIIKIGNGTGQDK